jgi:hypothetical protein
VKLVKAAGVFRWAGPAERGARGGGRRSWAGPTPNNGVELTASSVRLVRRESGMEECGNISGIQVPDEPLGLSVADHSAK